MMEYKGYLGKIDIDGEELYGTVVNLHRDHVDFRGRTIDEVRRAFHESVDFYLDGCRQDGEEPERPLLREIRCAVSRRYAPPREHAGSHHGREPEYRGGGGARGVSYRTRAYRDNSPCACASPQAHGRSTAGRKG